MRYQVQKPEMQRKFSLRLMIDYSIKQISARFQCMHIWEQSYYFTEALSNFLITIF